MPASTSSTALHAAVGTPAASMISLANAFEPSSRAAAALGPNAAIPRAASSSTSPATSGASGPTTTRSQPSAAATSPAMSSTATSTSSASAAIPGLPGAHSSCGARGERASARTSACSRPPAPTTRTRIRPQTCTSYSEVMKSSIGNAGSVSYIAVPRELSSIDTRAIVMSSGASTTLMKSQRPSVAHCALTFGAQLLDLAVDLLDALRVVLHRLDALGRQRGEHEIRRHGGSIGRSQASRHGCIPSRGATIVRNPHRAPTDPLPSTHDAADLWSWSSRWRPPSSRPPLPPPRRSRRARAATRSSRTSSSAATGYAPMGKVAISRDGEPFGTADADAAGDVHREVPRGRARRAAYRESVSTLTAIDGALNTASTRYRTSRIFADFAPATGDPRTLKVRFEVNGFGLLRRNASVYLHYVNPRGKGVRTVRLGTARGTCGKITRTRAAPPVPVSRSPSAAAGSCSSTRTASTRARRASRRTSGCASPSRSTAPEFRRRVAEAP